MLRNYLTAKKKKYQHFNLIIFLFLLQRCLLIIICNYDATKFILRDANQNKNAKKRQITELEMEEIVRQQTREFKKEIEKRFIFPYGSEKDSETEDSSLRSLENIEVYNLHNQNNPLGMRKKSLSEKILRPLNQPKENLQSLKEKPKSQERQKVENNSLSNKILLEKGQGFSPDVQFGMPQWSTISLLQNNQYQGTSLIADNISSQRYMTNTGSNQKTTVPKNILNDLNTCDPQKKTTVSRSTLSPYATNMRITNEAFKSTLTVQNKIQRLIQDTLNRSNEKSLNKNNNNQNLLKLLQKNGIIKNNDKSLEKKPSEYLVQAQLNKLPNRQITSPQYQAIQQRSYFSKHSPNMMRQASKPHQRTDYSFYINDQSNQSLHRTMTQHDSNNTSRCQISGTFNFQQILQPKGISPKPSFGQTTITPLHQHNQSLLSNTSRIGGNQKSDSKLLNRNGVNIFQQERQLREKTNQMSISPNRSINNKSFQENFQVYSNIPTKSRRIPTQPSQKTYIQVEHYLKQVIPPQEIHSNDIREQILKLTSASTKSNNQAISEKPRIAQAKLNKYTRLIQTPSDQFKVNNYSIGY